jgi:hypothetical protein
VSKGGQLRRSVSVPLVILGGLTMGACSRSDIVSVQQQVYNSREECERDWNDSSRCSQDASRGSSGGGYLTGSSAGNWYGPRYYWDRDLKRPVQLNADGSRWAVENSRITEDNGRRANSMAVGEVSRNGFGSSAYGGSGGG